MTQYLAKARNPEYKGTIAGVSFHGGEAILNEEIAAETGRTLGEILFILKDLGITITEQGGADDQYICEECGREFGSQKALSGHQKAHRKQEVSNG